ncbi:MAG: GIY-YIG nuclease family protein [Candidatus Omnitrophica bacterium]|nr:GIY-YIG nuclease family protein [Candidatus Omnitrophota bacterium]
MYFVYALATKNNTRIYVGLTKNLKLRTREHNSGKTKSTKAYKPWILFYSEKFNTRLEARAREKVLKSGFGKEFLKNILKNVPVAQQDRASAFQISR